MIIVHAYLHLDLPEVHSLKGRRAVINALKEKLKTFNLSLLDISGEYAKEADIAFVFLSHDAKQAAQYLDKIERMIESRFGEYEWELQSELL